MAGMKERPIMEERRIAVVTTGGTITMTGPPYGPGETGLPLLRKMKRQSRVREPPKGALAHHGEPLQPEHVKIQTHAVVNLDSVDLSVKELNKLGEKLVELSNDADVHAIVVTGGTDKLHRFHTRMAHHLHNLNKPVVFTGAQIPHGRKKSDARRNYEQGIRVAYDLSNAGLNQVVLCFAKRPPIQTETPSGKLKRPPFVGEVYHALNSLKAHADRPDAFHHTYKRILAEVTRRRGTVLTELGQRVLKLEKQRIAQETTFTPIQEDLLQQLNLVSETISPKTIKISSRARALVVLASGKGNLRNKILRRLANRAGSRPIVIATEAGAHVDLTSYVPGVNALKRGMLPSGGLIPVTAEIRAEYLAHKMPEIEQYATNYKPRNLTVQEFKQKLFAALYLSGARFIGRDTKKKHEAELGIKIAKDDVVINASIHEALVKAHAAIKEFENKRKPPSKQLSLTFDKT